MITTLPPPSAVATLTEPIDDPGAAAPGTPGWQARIRLRYGPRDGATRVVEREHRGPLVVQKALYPEGPRVCHTYLLHPPGGVVGGDRLELSVAVDPGADALITTPAATKLYRSAGPRATIDQRFSVAGGATLEWLPQETIAFDGCQADVQTSVELAPGAGFIGWELLALGRPAIDERFRHGRVTQSLRLDLSGRPLLRERLDLAGADPALEAPWGLAGRGVVGTLLAISPSGVGTVLVDRLRAGLAERSHPAAATVVDDLLVVRVLAPGTRHAMATLAETWRLLRPDLLSRPAEPPRIWST